VTSIAVETIIWAPPTDVWACIRDIASHVEWMHDARAITFTSEKRQGVGTSFDCLTRLGPLRTTDRMVITEWEDERTMGVRHEGLVTGTGAFHLEALDGGRTRFSWEETLTFPLWLGGSIGERLGGPILRAVWRRNLKSLARLVEGRGGQAG
jgi:uncharacterized protein YndB with AHSA1/START domain